MCTEIQTEKFFILFFSDNQLWLQTVKPWSYIFASEPVQNYWIRFIFLNQIRNTKDTFVTQPSDSKVISICYCITLRNLATTAYLAGISKVNIWLPTRTQICNETASQSFTFNNIEKLGTYYWIFKSFIPIKI